MKFQKTLKHSLLVRAAVSCLLAALGLYGYPTRDSSCLLNKEMRCFKKLLTILGYSPVTQTQLLKNLLVSLMSHPSYGETTEQYFRYHPSAQLDCVALTSQETLQTQEPYIACKLKLSQKSFPKAIVWQYEGSFWEKMEPFLESILAAASEDHTPLMKDPRQIHFSVRKDPPHLKK